MRRTIIVMGISIALIHLVAGNFVFREVSFEYWIWLGFPNPIGMLFVENYPGHNFTAAYRHENYFVKIPSINMGYEDVIEKYGAPIEIVWDEENNKWIYGVYENFTVGFIDSEQNIETSSVRRVIITGDDIPLTRDKIRVGDSKDRIIYYYRYYRTLPHDALTNGYTIGYLDGSILTGQTWIEFKFDQDDNVEEILLYTPWS